MKRSSLVISLTLISLFLLNSCSAPPVTPPPTPTATSVPASDLGIYLLAELNGTITRTRPGWTQQLPLSVATLLTRNDLLHVAPDASGAIVCADLRTVVAVSANYIGGSPCPQHEPLIKHFNGELVVRPLRQTPEVLTAIPYLLTPRRTFITDGHPLLRWHGSAEGAPYTVRVWGDGLNWESVTNETELRYPEDAPALQPGAPYHVTVRDSLGHSSDEEKDKTALDLSFALMSPVQVAELERLLAQVDALQVNETAISLLKAEIYSAHNARSDAILLLKGVMSAKPAPTIHTRLADLYLSVGLYLEAEAGYGQALETYRALGDIAGEAAALAGLGAARRGLNQEEAAIADLEAAARIYETLNDLDALAQIRRRIAEIGGAP